LLVKPTKDNKYKLINKVPLIGAFDVKSLDDTAHIKTSFELRGNGKAFIFAMKTLQDKNTFISAYKQTKSEVIVKAEKRSQPAIIKAKQYIEQRYKITGSSDNKLKPEEHSTESGSVSPHIRAYRRSTTPKSKDNSDSKNQKIVLPVTELDSSEVSASPSVIISPDP